MTELILPEAPGRDGGVVIRLADASGYHLRPAIEDDRGWFEFTILPVFTPLRTKQEHSGCSAYGEVAAEVSDCYKLPNCRFMNQSPSA